MAQDYELIGRRAKVARVIQTGLAIFLYVFMLAPIVLIVAFSFNENPLGTFPFTGITTKWYEDALHNDQILSALFLSLKIAVLVTIVSVILGVCAAFPLVRAKLRFRNGIRIAYVIPLMIPPLLVGVGALLLFTQILHTPLGMMTTVIGQSLITTPFVVLIVTARLDGFDRSLERAANDLGADSWQTFYKVTLPIISPAIAVGAAFAFVLSLDEFYLSSFLLGHENSLPIYIYTQIRFGITPEVNAVVSLILGFSIFLLLIGVVLPRAMKKLKNPRAKSAL